MTPRPVVAVAAGLCLGVVTVGCTDAGASRHASHETATRPWPRPGPRRSRTGSRAWSPWRSPATRTSSSTCPRCSTTRTMPSARSGSTLADADLTMLNLESAITERGSRDPKELEDPADRFWYRASWRALDLLAGAGVDVVTVANNHGADYGPEGLADTLRAADHGPIPVVGVGTRPRGGLHAVPRDGRRHPDRLPRRRRLPPRGAQRRLGGRSTHSRARRRPRRAHHALLRCGPQRGRARRGRGGVPALGRGGPRLPEPGAA